MVRKWGVCSTILRTYHVRWKFPMFFGHPIIWRRLWTWKESCCSNNWPARRTRNYKTRTRQNKIIRKSNTIAELTINFCSYFLSYRIQFLTTSDERTAEPDTCTVGLPCTWLHRPIVFGVTYNQISTRIAALYGKSAHSHDVPTGVRVMENISMFYQLM